MYEKLSLKVSLLIWLAIIYLAFQLIFAFPVVITYLHGWFPTLTQMQQPSNSESDSSNHSVQF